MSKEHTNVISTYRSGMHIAVDCESGKISITADFGQVRIDSDQASVLIGLLEGALEQIGIQRLDIES